MFNFIKSWFTKPQSNQKPSEPKIPEKPYGLSPSSMSISQKGIDLIKEFEGFKANAYLDVVGVPTIGYGTTQGVKLGQTVTQAQAEKLLRDDVKKFEKALKEAIKVPVTQNQWDALVSWTYNVGSGAMAKSTLIKLLNMSDYRGAADQLPRWNKAGGKTIGGLTRRRQAERELFLK